MYIYRQFSARRDSKRNEQSPSSEGPMGGGRNFPPPQGTPSGGGGNLNCKFKTFGILDIKYNCNLYNKGSSFFYMFAMTGQTAESNGLNFSKETHGYP